jgi:exosortase/archaeosortase family protein
MLINKKYPEALFIIKLLLLFSIFYYGTQFYIGITSKGNYYNAFLDKYFNYINWLRCTILKSASIVCYIFGYDTKIENIISLRVVNGYKVNMVYSCLGIGILSSWAAFAIAFPNNLKRKIIWLFAGLLTIWFANVIRVAVLLMLLNKTKDVKGFPNHHTIFNVIAYMIVIVLIYFYSKEKTVKSEQ